MITPLLHYVLIKLDPVEEVTKGGIIIPDEATKKERKATETGTVVVIGPTAFEGLGGSRDCIKVGQKILINRYSGKDVTDPDTNEKFVVVNDSDILVVFGD